MPFQAAAGGIPHSVIPPSPKGFYNPLYPQDWVEDIDR